jgi:hypothetical protein
MIERYGSLKIEKRIVLEFETQGHGCTCVRAPIVKAPACNPFRHSDEGETNQGKNILYTKLGVDSDVPRRLFLS